MAYHIVFNVTKRIMPEIATGLHIMRYVRRRNGESIGFDDGGETASILDADGNTLAKWEFRY